MKSYAGNLGYAVGVVGTCRGLQSVNGKEYKNATITRVEVDGIVIRSKAGIAKIYFIELPAA